jgi:hypothetical protein
MKKTRSSHRHHHQASKTMKMYQNHATMHDIQHWHKHMFEKLGWMILSKHYGYGHKITAYKEGLKHLKKTIENKMATIQEQDRLEDLKILHHNLCVLMEHVDKDFS